MASTLACRADDTSVLVDDSGSTAVTASTGAASTSPATSTGPGTGSSASDTGSSGPGSTGNPVLLDVGPVGGTGDTEGGMAGPPTFPETCLQAEASQTSVGCEFYPLSLPQFGGTGDTGLFVATNVSQHMATVTLSDADGVLESVLIPPGGMHQFVTEPEHGLSSSTHTTLDGYVIESDEVLQVFSMMPVLAAVTSDAGLVFPRSALGTRHRVATYNGWLADNASDQGSQYVAVVATENNTDVTLTLAGGDSETLAGDGLPGLDVEAGNSSLTVTLDRLEVLVVGAHDFDALHSDFANDLTGSLVESSAPVAVYSGTTPTYLPAADPFVCCADLVTDAVPPTTVYGTAYAGVKFLPNGPQTDVWRFIGDLDGTTVTLSGGLDDVFTLAAGEFRDVETTQSFWAVGDKPFGLVHFMTSAENAGFTVMSAYDCDDMLAAGDPALSWAFPRDNWLNRYLFPVGPSTIGTWCNDHANVVASLDAWDSITLGGMPLPDPEPLGTSGHGFARVPLPDASYELLAPEGVGVELTVYGYIEYGSYVYPGGVGLTTLNPAG